MLPGVKAVVVGGASSDARPSASSRGGVAGSLLKPLSSLSTEWPLLLSLILLKMTAGQG